MRGFAWRVPLRDNPHAPYNFWFCVKGLAMPIYAYRCSACGHAKDVLQKMSDPVLHTCPACGAETYTKQLTAAGFQLKGSGWYATDFKGGGVAPAAGGAAAATDEPAKPADATGAPAPAAAPAAAGKADSGGGGGGGGGSASPTAATSGTGHGGGSCACH